MTKHTHELHPRSADWADEVRTCGLRVTKPRMLVLNYLDLHPHSDAEEIFQALAPHHPTLSIQAVHGVVNDLTEAGLVRRIDLPDINSFRYETRIDDNHHHVQCIKCGRIEDVDCVVGEAPCLTPSQTHGMQILAAHVSFQGICADCATRTAAAEATNTLTVSGRTESEHIDG